MQRRLVLSALIVFLWYAPAAHAHRLEPISTEFARPFQPWSGSLQLKYEFLRNNSQGMSTHLIPEMEFELGITRRTQFSAAIPLLLRIADGEPGAVGGGNMEFGFRYLLFGGSFNHYAVSFNSFIAPPTGDGGVAGNATEAGAALHFDKEFGEHAFFHGNYGWSTTIGGSEERERLFFYRSALVVPATLRWNPTLELLGSTDTNTRQTVLLAQPEMIYYVNRHWELKLGLPIGLTRASPGIGVRVQVGWVFGRGGTE